MITEKAKNRCKVLAFWEKYGDVATKEAFNISRRTLFRWQKDLEQARGKLDGLNARSTAPKKRNKRIVDLRVHDYLIEQRKLHYKIGKKKLASLVKEEFNITYSESKIGRILSEMKRRGLLPAYTRMSLYGRTGNLHERHQKRRKKLRIKGYRPDKAGDLVQVDTVVKFIDGIKRYVITAIDVESDFAFALAYKSLSSASAKDFMQKLEEVAPFKITHVQTDNGLEFEKYFRDYLNLRNILHFHNYPKCPKMNAFVERFNRTIQEQFVNWHLHHLRDDINHFNRDLIDWLLWYNTKRPHESLGMVSPLRYIVMTLPTRECHMWWTRTKYCKIIDSVVL
jgi:transposase InsO family protein